MPEAMCSVLLCTLEIVKGGLCSLEVLEVMCCVLPRMLEAVKGELCLLEVFKVLEEMHRMLPCIPE